MTTRAALAARLSRDLSALAQDAGWTDVPTSGQAEGHYTDPLDDGMRVAGVADLAAATPTQVEAVRVAALRAALVRLELYWSAQVDLKVGQRDEKLSQVAAALRKLVAAQDAQDAGSGASFTTGWVRDDGYKGQH